MAKIIPVDFKNLSRDHFDSIPVSDDFRRGVASLAVLAQKLNSSNYIRNGLDALVSAGLINIQEYEYLAELFGVAIL